MHCYNHQKKEAIGLCRNCFKGLCQECCQKSEDYLACSENCAQKVYEVEEMNERAKNIYGVGKYAKRPRLSLSVLLFFCLGILFAFWGVSDMIHYNDYFSSYNIFIVSLGVLFLFFSFLAWKRTSKIGIIL
ncbi:MAG: hypothetical protein K2P93_04150 [Alphaproteobacteria bacterium]|nr:hypothetical protein [Alphaproteobacteria bacterium]